MVLIPFPRLVRPNPLSLQVKYEGKLSKALESELSYQLPQGLQRTKLQWKRPLQEWKAC